MLCKATALFCVVPGMSMVSDEFFVCLTTQNSTIAHALLWLKARSSGITVRVQYCYCAIMWLVSIKIYIMHTRLHKSWLAALSCARLLVSGHRIELVYTIPLFIRTLQASNAFESKFNSARSWGVYMLRDADGWIRRYENAIKWARWTDKYCTYIARHNMISLLSWKRSQMRYDGDINTDMPRVFAQW